jgi:iron complex transport system ATP-binding protein
MYVTVTSEVTVTSGQIMLRIEHLSVSYGARRALADVSLEVNSGEVLALIGPNGAGKSSLVRAVSGVIPVQSGKVRTNGDDLFSLPPMQRARYLAVVPQVANMPPAFSVWETVVLGRTPYLNFLGQTSAKDEEIARAALVKVDALDLAERRVGELSGGEQQRVLLARALAQDTPVLLLDEPTTHLDLQHQSSLLNLVRQLADGKQLAVLMVLHDLNLASLYADRVALLVAGRLRASGTPQEVLNEQNLSSVYNVPVHVVPHPDYGSPLILPDGRFGAHP